MHKKSKTTSRSTTMDEGLPTESHRTEPDRPAFTFTGGIA